MQRALWRLAPWLWGALLTAQAPATTPRLVEVARVPTLGESRLERCVFSDDGSQMLTVGDAGEVLWWDLPRQRVKRRHRLAAGRVTVAVLLERDAAALCQIQGGAMVRLDLATGVAVPWSGDLNDHLPKDIARNWQAEGAPQGVARNGKHWLQSSRTGELVQVPEQIGAGIPKNATSWINNDGTVVFVLGTTAWAQSPSMRTAVGLPGHRGAVQRLVFTADGRHLAVVHPAGVRVVDAHGQESAAFPGPCDVHAATDGSDLWLLTATSLRRWNAAARRDVGPVVEWDPREFEPWEPWRFDRAVTAVYDGQPWAASGRRTASGAFVPVLPPDTPMERLRGEWSMAGSSPVLLLSTTSGASVWRFDRDGNVLGQQSTEPDASWLVASHDGSRLVIGTSRILVRVLDATDLSVIQKETIQPAVQRAAPFGPGRLLTTDGKGLSVYDNALAQVATWSEVADLPRITALAGSPDGRRLAVCCGNDVRILRVE